MGVLVKREVIRRSAEGKIECITDSIIRETPLTIFVNETEFVTLVCTPQYMEELGVGFLLSEGLIRESSDLDELELFNNGGFLKVKINSELKSINGFLRRNIASCCGKGRAGLYFINDAKQVEEVKSSHVFDVQILSNLIDELEKKGDMFNATGGAHFAALAKENIIFMFEDIGRHNAVDKVLGSTIIHKVDNTDKCLVLSGRISSEIVIKAARGGIPVILSKAAPTDLAIDLAEDLNISILGFARAGRMNIYSHEEKLGIK